MRAVAILALAGAVLAAGLCVRLGFWQLSRLREKQALNAARHTAEQAPAVRVTGGPPPVAAVQDRPLEAAGRYDEARQFLLSGRLHEGEPGVEVVTPLVLEGDSTAILVNRGWLPAADAATARPQDYPEPGVRTVRGQVEDMPHGAAGPPPRRLPGDGVALWSVRWLDADSISARLPYRVAGYVLREGPGPDVPPLPRRSARPPYDESTHLSYAIQWFSFAAIILGGTVAFVWSRRRRAGSLPDPERSP